MKALFPLLIVLLACTGLTAQSVEFTPAYPRVTQAGEELKLAWFGGLNTPQTQAADLDGDGNDDLYFFDKTGAVNLALRGGGNGNYAVAPDLVSHFPDDTQGWTMLRDFDQNGVPDMFRYSRDIDGIEVLRGSRRADGLLEFALIDFGDALPLLFFPFNGTRAPIFVSGIDYPGIEDMDFDGDLDIVTFAVNGGYVEYYKNQSVERGFGTDTLIYTLESRCWGGFFESGLTTALDLADAQGGCFDNLLPGGGGRPRHSGSTVTPLDYDGNGRMDLFLGDISFDRLVLGLNNGSADEAWISEQDTAWNDAGVIADIASFPAAYYVDIDQDGQRDIVGSPSTTLNGTDVEVMWYYRNTGTEAAPDFQFQSRKVLVEDMLDFGTAANVTTFDYDADGRPDLVIGNNDEYTPDNSLDSRFRLLRNVTPEGGEIAFELIDEDYLGMSAFRSTGWAFAPAFGDLDDDGDLDVVIGDRSGKLFYGENTAGPGNEAAFAQLVFEWQGIDAGQFSKPFIADLDRDGLQDLLVGGFDGRIRFYRNVGTARAAVFDPDLSAEGNQLQLGGINANSPGISTGHPAPWVLQNPDYTMVVVGNRIGEVKTYRFGADTAYSEPYTLLEERAGGLSVGGFANPGFADFDGDGKLEMVLGTQRGGANFFRTNLNPDATTPLRPAPKPSFAFSAAPNPASSRLTVSGWPAGAATEISLFTATGKLIRKEQLAARTQVQWTVNGLAPGVYLLRLTGAGGAAARKVIVR